MQCRHRWRDIYIDTQYDLLPRIMMHICLTGIHVPPHACTTDHDTMYIHQKIVLHHLVQVSI